MEVRDGLLETPFVQDGRLPLPTAPGLGFTVDPRKPRRHGRHFFKATKLRTAVRAVLDKGLATARELGAVRDARMATHGAELDAMVARGEDVVKQALTPPSFVDTGAPERAA